MPRRTVLTALSVVVLASACRTAGPTAPRAADMVDPLSAYVGELRLLRHEGSRRQIRLDARSRVPDGCAVAVRVHGTALAKGTASFFLETLGTARLGDRRVDCGRMQPELELTVSGIPANASVSEVAERVDKLLQTPEAYLASQGVRFDLAPGEAPTEAACRETFATNDEAKLARSVTAWPLPLLAVDPWRHEAGRRITRQQSEAELEAMVGCDGRLHKPRLRTGLGEAHARAVLQSLPLWRFTPARRGDVPVAARVSLRPVLHIY